MNDTIFSPTQVIDQESLEAKLQWCDSTDANHAIQILITDQSPFDPTEQTLADVSNSEHIGSVTIDGREYPVAAALKGYVDLPTEAVYDSQENAHLDMSMAQWLPVTLHALVSDKPIHHIESRTVTFRRA